MTIAGGHLTSRLGLDHTTTVGGHMTSLRGLARMTTVGGHRTSLMGLNRKMNVGARTERVRGLERVTTLVGTSPRDRRHARTQNGPFLWHHLWAQGSSSARGQPCPRHAGGHLTSPADERIDGRQLWQTHGQLRCRPLHPSHCPRPLGMFGTMTSHPPATAELRRPEAVGGSMPPPLHHCRSLARAKSGATTGFGRRGCVA